MNLRDMLKEAYEDGYTDRSKEVDYNPDGRADSILADPENKNEPVFIGWYEEDAYGPNSEQMMFESLGVETVTIQRPDWEEAGCPNPIAVRFEQAKEAEIEAYSGYMADDDQTDPDDVEAPQIESSQGSQAVADAFWDDKGKQHQSREG